MPEDAAARGGPVQVTEDVLRGWPLPDPGSDKHGRGTIVVVGGSARTPGAVLLAGEAALRAGAGKLQIATATEVATPLSVAVPEALVLALEEHDGGVLGAPAAPAIVEAARQADAVLLGPGLLDVSVAAELVTAVVAGLADPDDDSGGDADGDGGPAPQPGLVLDALGTAFVTEHPDGLRPLHGRCVITTNPSELSLILHCEQQEVTDDLTGAAGRAAELTGAVVLCGGDGKGVADPDGRTWRVDAGGPGLGVSGSGDVQAGLVAGLLARGADPAQAAVWGAYLHATAGDLVGERTGPLGYLAREVPPVVPELLHRLTEGPSAGSGPSGRGTPTP